MRVIGSGQRTIARFEKSPTWSSGTSRLFWLANVFFAHIIWPMCKGLGGGVVVLKYMYGLYGYLPLNLECFFPLWLWNRVYKTTLYLWKRGIFYFILNLKQGRFIVRCIIGIPVRRLRGVERWPQKQWTPTSFYVTHTILNKISFTQMGEQSVPHSILQKFLKDVL